MELNRLSDIVNGAKPETGFERWFAGEITLGQYLEKDARLFKVISDIRGPSYAKSILEQEEMSVFGTTDKEVQRHLLKTAGIKSLHADKEFRDNFDIDGFIYKLFYRHRGDGKKVTEDLRSIAPLVEYYGWQQKINEAYAEQQRKYRADCARHNTSQV